MINYKYVKGFVINIYDVLNYDIDFLFLKKPNFLDQVISNEYKYRNIMKNGELSNELKSISYRCRLNGIEINSKYYNRKNIKMYTYEIKKLLNRSDLYINVEIKGIDIFNRLLINIVVPGLNIDICEFLLYKSIQDKNYIFNKYSKNKNIKIKNL